MIRVQLLWRLIAIKPQQPMPAEMAQTFRGNTAIYAKSIAATEGYVTIAPVHATALMGFTVPNVTR